MRTTNTPSPTYVEIVPLYPHGKRGAVHVLRVPRNMSPTRFVEVFQRRHWRPCGVQWRVRRKG